MPVEWGYALLRDFHKYADTMMVATPGLQTEMEERGFSNIKLWGRGVDTEIFKPVASDVYDHLPRPIFTYVGRIAVEKSIEDFLKLDLPGTKVVVGAGPMEEELKAKYKDIFWAGPKYGDDLVKALCGLGCFRFPLTALILSGWSMSKHWLLGCRSPPTLFAAHWRLWKQPPSALGVWTRIYKKPA